MFIYSKDGIKVSTCLDTQNKTLLSGSLAGNAIGSVYKAHPTKQINFEKKKSKQEIKNYIINTFGYDLNRTCDEIRPDYPFEVSCQASVPEAIIAFLDSTDFESTIRLAVSLGGDSDTQACIAGSIAEAFYGGVPEPIATEVLKRLPQELKDILSRFTPFVIER